MDNSSPQDVAGKTEQLITEKVIKHLKDKLEVIKLSIP